MDKGEDHHEQAVFCSPFCRRFPYNFAKVLNFAKVVFPVLLED